MAEGNTRLRLEVAHWAQQYLDGGIPFERFLNLAPEEPEDQDIEELIDLIVHEPKRGGLFGVSAADYETHMRRIRELIEILNAS